MSDSMSSIGSKLTLFEENIRKSSDSRSNIFIANVARKSSKQARREKNSVQMRPTWSRNDSTRSMVSESDQSLSTASLTLFSDDATLNYSRNRSSSSSLRARVSFIDDTTNNSATFAQIDFGCSTNSIRQDMLWSSTGQHAARDGDDNNAYHRSVSSLRPDSWSGMTINAKRISVGNVADDKEDFYQSFSSLRPGSWANPV